MTPLWPHQEYAVSATLAAIARGLRRVLLSSPTGGGKTRVSGELIRHYLRSGKKVVVYTNRKLLVEQTSRVLAELGLRHGVRSAGYAPEQGLPLQVSSVQTEHRRAQRNDSWTLHEADLALVDEAHLQGGAMARRLMDAHHARGAAVVGLTATPLDLGDVYDELVVAGCPSELRGCGALVRAHHFAPDEPDLRHVRKYRLGEDLSERDNAKAVMVPGVFGRVIEGYRRYNPAGRPAILFAPGVGESLGFAEAFEAAGIPAAHIDGGEVWVGGRTYRSSREARADVLAGSRDGRVKVLCNRFVLREGIDAPWLEHGILATVFGSLQSYLQSGGRLLRASPGKECCTVQDHGGSWWRHGSLNEDRCWRLELTGHRAAAEREDRFRAPPPGERPPPQPARCPVCHQVILCARCRCGWEHRSGRRSRPVVQIDGSLLEMQGDVFRPRRVSARPEGIDLWRQMYHRSRTEAGRRTFRAAAALYARENDGLYPDPNWPLMPRDPDDWYRHVADVPGDRLR